MALHAASAPLPAFPYEFDAQTRDRARHYERDGRMLSLLGGTALPVVLALALFFTGASARLARWAQSWVPGSPTAGDALYTVLFVGLFALAMLPVGFYLGHIRERRFGLTQRPSGAFFRDAGKGALVATVFALLLLLPFFWLARRYGDWWLWAALLYGAYIVVSAAVVPQLVLPFFYRVERLPDGPMRDAVATAVGAAGLTGAANIVVLEESAKSRRANAFVHGFGRTRRIVLYDTLVKSFHPREVAFTVAHEVGHLAHRDVPKSMAASLAIVVPELFLLSVTLAVLAPFGGAAGAADPAVLPLLFSFIVAVGVVTRPGSAWLHRRAERRADEFALSATGDGAAAASMLRRVCDLNLLDDSPPPLVERLFRSHPAPRRRIEDALAHAGPTAPPGDHRTSG